MNYKKISGLLLVLLCFSLSAQAQKFAYVDSEVILKKMPDYEKAQKDLAAQTEQWDKEIQALREGLVALRQKFEAEKVLLTADMIKQREEAINKKENELKLKQSEVFGFEGLLFKKRKELIRPIQDKILEACRAVAKRQRVQFIFDKATDLHMLYSDPTYNFTDFVMEELGLEVEGSK